MTAARALIVAPELEELARSVSFATVEEIVVLDDRYEAWLAGARETGEQAVQEWDPFTIPYTAGTTGKPKGVVLPHRARTLCFLAMASEYGCYAPDDRNLVTAPLFHGAGFAFAMATLFLGGYYEILPRFDPELLLRHLHAGHMSTTFMAPAHFHALFALEPTVLDRDSGVGAIISNAAPLAEASKERIVDYFGEIVLHETYGSTEGAIVTNLRPDDQLRKIESVGLSFVATQVSIRCEDGGEAEAGEVGELFSASPYLFNGYWERPEETAKTIIDGWVTAGDMAVRDEEGFVYLIDRKTDMIISGGINLYPREIEEVLFQHPTVAEAAVVDVPDERWSEAMKAFVVTRPGATIEPDALTAHCRVRLTGYKVPKTVEVVDALSRNAAGKVLRRALREPARLPRRAGL